MWPTADAITAIVEAVCERDADETRLSREDDRAHADEDQREGADELGDPAAKGVVLHARRLRARSDGVRYGGS